MVFSPRAVICSWCMRTGWFVIIPLKKYRLRCQRRFYSASSPGKGAQTPVSEILLHLAHVPLLYQNKTWGKCIDFSRLQLIPRLPRAESGPVCSKETNVLMIIEKTFVTNTLLCKTSCPSGRNFPNNLPWSMRCPLHPLLCMCMVVVQINVLLHLLWG